MINVDLEKLLWMQIDEEIEIKTNGKTYTINRKSIDNIEYLVFNEKDNNQNVKMNIDKIGKIRNYTRLQQERLLDNIDFFFEDIYNNCDVELNLI
jgi:hypothetical protein